MAERLWVSTTACEVPGWLLGRRNVSSDGKLLYGRLVALARDTGCVSESITAICRSLGMPPGHVEDLLQKMAAVGLVDVSQARMGDPSLRELKSVIWLLRHEWQAPPARSPLPRRQPRAREEILRLPFHASENPEGNSKENDHVIDKDKLNSSGSVPSGEPEDKIRSNSLLSEEENAPARPREGEPNNEAQPAQGRTPTKDEKAPSARRNGSEAPWLGKQAIDALEALWRASIEASGDPTAPAPWLPGERGQLGRARAKYDDETLRALVSYVGTHWQELRRRYPNAPERPDVLWALFRHGTLVPTAQTWAKHQGTLAAWEAWQQAHKNDVAAQPPPGLVAAVGAARTALAPPGKSA